jgi:hypothetical protein
MSRDRLSQASILLIAALFLAAPGFATAQSTERKTKPTGTIAGRVTLNDKGAPDILVAAQLDDRQSQQPPIRAKTDSSGHYRLTGLAAGQYQVMAVAPAMVTEQSLTNSYYGPSKSVVVSAGEEIDDIDISLARGGVITGRVTDADGKPVVEQRLNVQMIDQAGNAIQRRGSYSFEFQMGQTDDRGIYRIYGLAAGRYRISVGSSEGGLFSTSNHSYYRLTFYGDTNNEAKASLVELLEGSEATNIDIHLGRASGTFAATGRVIDAQTGQAIPGAAILYGPARPNEPFHGGFSGMPASPRGEFRIEGLEPGHYGVSIASGSDGSPFYADPIFFDVSDGDLSNLEVKATRGLTLSGVVVFEGSRAKELQQQVAVLRVVANITSPSNQQNQASPFSSIAPDGSFHIGGVRSGKVRMFIGPLSMSALRGVAILRVERGGVDVTQSLEIQGESISDLRVVAGLGNGTISGTVKFIGGTPPPNLYSTIFARGEGNNAQGYGYVDARGRFLIKNLIAGSYEVTLNIGFNGGQGRRLPPLKQRVAVTDDGNAEVDFVMDLTLNEGAP